MQLGLIYSVNTVTEAAKNLNSLAQHELRCEQNPDRRDFERLASYIVNNVKGKTKENCPSIQKQAQTMRQRYASGWVPPTKGKARGPINYVHKDHNDKEIEKWIEYVASIDLDIPDYTTYMDGRYYVVSDSVLTAKYNCRRMRSTILLEHVYLMMLVLGEKLTQDCVIHHVDEDPSNNDIRNLIAFATKGDHTRYHISAYAYLTYDEETHLFTCSNVRN